MEYAAANCAALTKRSIRSWGIFSCRSCNALQNRRDTFFLSEEILIELREQFHEIMVHIGTAQTLVLCLGRQTVESVTEFMQERLNLVGIEKHRVAACRFREIADNRKSTVSTCYPRHLLSRYGIQSSRHPRTLAGTIEEIGIKDTEKLSVILAYTS